MVPKKIIIINPIDAHLLSSPSMSSKMKVAAVPAMTAKHTRNQNNLFNFLSFSLFSAMLIGGSAEGESGTGCRFFWFQEYLLVLPLWILFLNHLGSTVGLDFFFLNFAK